VLIRWSVSDVDGHRRFVFCWEERGGPAVIAPVRKGFGSAVLVHVMAEYFDVPPRFQFAPTGMKYELIGSVDALLS
jgi:hypothetical protein